MRKIDTATGSRQAQRTLASLLPLAIVALTGGYAPGLYFTSCDV